MVVETRVYSKALMLTEREQLLVLEIGGDRIDSASLFVNYISEAYGFSKSSVWYILNKLKEKGLAEFASREEPGKALTLTPSGMTWLRGLERSRPALTSKFSNMFLSEEAPQSAEGGWLRVSVRAVG